VRHGRTVARLVLAAVIAVASTVVVAGTSAGAQTAAPAFVLAGQSPWTAPGGLFLLRLRATNVAPGSEVALTVHDSLQSRTAFDESVNGGSLPPTRELTKLPFDTLPTDAATGDRLVLLRTEQLATGGVYPLEVDLRSAGDESVARFVTHVVVPDLAADGSLAVGQPLHVAWVWPLRADPAYVADPVSFINPSTLADLATTGRLGRQAQQLAANTDVPLTLAPSPETLDAWSTLAQKAAAVASGAPLQLSASRNQVLAGPFVPLDLPAVLDSGLSGVVNPELARGITALESFFGTHIDPSTALPGPLDAASLTLLQNASARQLVLDGDALTPVVEQYTPAHPYKMQVVAGDDASAVTVVATDPGLEKFLAGDDPPALRAAHLLAGLALVAEEQPSLPRGVAIANPERWDADSTFVTAVLAGLRNNPLLDPGTVSDLLAAVPVATVDGAEGGAPVYRQLEPYTAPATPVSLRQYQKAETDRNRVASLVGASDPASVSAADRALASSVAADWQNPAGRMRARQLLAGIRSSVDGVLHQIQVQPQTTITVTSSKAEIPIGFRNNGDQDMTVHLKLESDRLLFPDGAERDILLPHKRSTTVRVAVETRGSGTSPVQMTVTTADGLPIGATTTIKVRSSFVSGVGIFLTVGAIVFLALWWGWDIRRRHKRKGDASAKPRPIPTTAGQPA
jgi:hypothetical protein